MLTRSARPECKACITERWVHPFRSRKCDRKQFVHTSVITCLIDLFHRGAVAKVTLSSPAQLGETRERVRPVNNFFVCVMFLLFSLYYFLRSFFQFHVTLLFPSGRRMRLSHNTSGEPRVCGCFYWWRLLPTRCGYLWQRIIRGQTLASTSGWRQVDAGWEGGGRAVDLMYLTQDVRISRTCLSASHGLPSDFRSSGPVSSHFFVSKTCMALSRCRCLT